MRKKKFTSLRQKSLNHKYVLFSDVRNTSLSYHDSMKYKTNYIYIEKTKSILFYG